MSSTSYIPEHFLFFWLGNRRNCLIHVWYISNPSLVYFRFNSVILLYYQVYGAGDQTRSFQYVSDLVDGLVALMNGNYSQPVNIGNPDEHTIIEFAQLIRKLVGT